MVDPDMKLIFVTDPRFGVDPNLKALIRVDNCLLRGRPNYQKTNMNLKFLVLSILGYLNGQNSDGSMVRYPTLHMKDD